MSKYTPGVVLEVQIKDLKPNPNNPDSRTRESALNTLMRKLDEFGFLPAYAIAIDPNGKIVEGHRRALAAKKAGFNEVWAFVLTEDQALESDTIITAQSATRKYSGVDIAHSHWIDPDSLPYTISRVRLELAQNIMGLELYEEYLNKDEMASAGIMKAQQVYDDLYPDTIKNYDTKEFSNVLLFMFKNKLRTVYQSYMRQRSLARSDARRAALKRAIEANNVTDAKEAIVAV